MFRLLVAGVEFQSHKLRKDFGKELAKVQRTTHIFFEKKKFHGYIEYILVNFNVLQIIKIRIINVLIKKFCNYKDSSVSSSGLDNFIFQKKAHHSLRRKIKQRIILNPFWIHGNTDRQKVCS